MDARKGIAMFLKRVDGPRMVTLPDGTVMTRADLPPMNTRRWVASRKAAVVKAIAAGLISGEEACRRYGLSEQELTSWQTAIMNFGEVALKATAVQKYRQL